MVSNAGRGGGGGGAGVSRFFLFFFTFVLLHFSCRGRSFRQTETGAGYALPAAQQQHLRRGGGDRSDSGRKDWNLKNGSGRGRGSSSHTRVHTHTHTRTRTHTHAHTDTQRTLYRPMPAGFHQKGHEKKRKERGKNFFCRWVDGSLLSSGSSPLDTRQVKIRTAELVVDLAAMTWAIIIRRCRRRR